MESVPTELDAVAKIDGLSNLGVLFRVILPLCRAGLFAAGALTFIGSWNEFVAGSVFVDDSSLTAPVQVAVYQYISAFGRQRRPLTAPAALAVIPILVLVGFLGRHLVKGLIEAR